ncbi:translation initiation factor 2 [Paenibacillus spiritus]|uniref:Translation initiation factor 2 n=1 Tax=Paenibacillus spiritus TaxID=2496557 RepID=A0A5J5FZS3_9BACL|nr:MULTISPECIES: translation initiation factor 2 [Paenibacillus]KAA8999685.1 translation initiation factor 2 [Paenibacillus spiritus]
MANNKDLRDIEIAKLAFIGGSIAAIGDGIAALAAGLALDALKQDYAAKKKNPTVSIKSTKTQLNYFINELVKIRNKVG